MLIGNGALNHKLLGRFQTGTSLAGDRVNFGKTGNLRNSLLSEVAFQRFSSRPEGQGISSSWLLPTSLGGVASRNELTGFGNLSAQGALGVNIIASLVSSGGVALATGALLVSVIAVLSSSGNLSASILGKLEAVASLSASGNAQGSLGAVISLTASLIGDGNLSSSIAGKLEAVSVLLASGNMQGASTGIAALTSNLTASGDLTVSMRGILSGVSVLIASGNIQGAINAIGALSISLTGSGSFVGSQYAIGYLFATIRGYGDLTPEAIRDSVWNATAANFNTTGSTGQKLNNAASGGVDYVALGQAVWANATRTLTSTDSPTTAQITAALISALNTTTIPVDLQKVKGQQVIGTGVETDPWRPV
jgi:hypothetical protein